MYTFSRRNKDHDEDPLDSRSLEPVFLDDAAENSLHRASRLQDGKVSLLWSAVTLQNENTQSIEKIITVFCGMFMDGMCTRMFRCEAAASFPPPA